MKQRQPTAESHLMLNGPNANPYDLRHLSDNLTGTTNIDDMPWKLQISVWIGLTRPRRFPFAFVCLTHTCCQSCVFKTLVLSFHGSNHLDDPYFLRPIYGPHCNP